MPKIWDEIKGVWKDVNDATSAVASGVGVYGTGVAEEGFKAAGKAATKFGNAINAAAKGLKASSAVSKVASFVGGAAKMLGPIGGILSFWADRKKDAMIEAQLSGLATDVGNLKDGLNNVKADLEAQGKALNGKIDGVKSELEGAIQQQGEKFDKEIKNLDAKIAQASASQKQALQKERDERKREMAQQKQELESQINEVNRKLTQAQEALKQELEDFKNEVNERFEQQEQKILANKRKIEEERIKREEEIREVNDKIKFSNTNTENLRKEKEQLEDEVLTFKSQINQQTAETQQAYEDNLAEYERKIKILETQIEDNQETSEEFNENLTTLKNEQAKHNIQISEITEDLQENNDILHAQQRKLHLVSQQMEDIQEEVHVRMDNLSKDLNQRTTETLNIAKDANKKVDNLSQQVKDMRENMENLEEELQKNKEETEQAKKQAQLANERLDNLLKSQTLNDYSQETDKLNKIQKSLELKTEEAKLLATLNLLKETKNLIHLNKHDKEWLVGIKQGTETDLSGNEGMLLNPNSHWAKNYTPEQLREWGWDTRLLGEHDQAPLLSEEAEKKESQVEERQSKEQEGEEEVATQEASQAVLEEVSQAQRQVLEQLQAIQAEIAKELEEIENTPSSPSPPKPSTATSLKVVSAESKVKIKKQALERQKQAEKQAQRTAQNKPTKQNQKEVQTAQEEIKKAEKELSEAQEQLKTLEVKQDFEETLEKTEEEITEAQQIQVQQQWQQIQALSKQALEIEKEEKPEDSKEEELEKKLEEITQQLIQQEVSQAASKKTMTKFMLFLIIFLLEYIVYKKNGLPGLIILNVILLICYWYKDQIMEYADLFSNYLLIIGYVMGNVLAYNSVENPDYKMPMVYGFNAIIGLIYAYTYWERLGGKQLAEKTYQTQIDKLREEFKVNSEEWKEIQAKSVQPQPQTWTEKAKRTVSESDYNIYSNTSTEIKFQQLAHLQEFVHQREEAERKEEQMKKQAETLQKATELEKELKESLAEAQEGLNDTSTTWRKIGRKIKLFGGKNKKPLTDYEKKWAWADIQKRWPEHKDKSILLKAFAEVDKTILSRETQGEEKEISPSLLNKLEKLPVPSQEELNIISQLYLPVEKFAIIASQAQYLTANEREQVIENFPNFQPQLKLSLINSGLNCLGINTLQKKEIFVNLNRTLYQEKANFGLTLTEKENILRMFINELDLTREQQQALEQMGVRFFNASEWEISEEQKQPLLKAGLNRVKLTEEQQEELINIHPERLGLTQQQDRNIAEEKKYLETWKYFELNDQQENILSALAPLTREDKYSRNTLQILYSLKLKPNHLAFFTNEEILPNPNLEFGEVKSPYLPLKLKFLLGEQKILKNQQEIKEKQLKAEEITANKQSIITSLLEWYENQEETQFTLTLDDYVKKEALKGWQRDILLICGFKTIPKYNFFELLIFAVENFTDDTFTDFLQENKWLKEYYQEYLNSLKETHITINREAWEKYADKNQKEWAIFKNLKLEELINEKINQALADYQPREVFYESSEEFEEDWKNISLDFTAKLVKEWQNNSFSYETTKEWIDIGLKPTESHYANWLRDNCELTPEEVLNWGDKEELRNKYQEFLKEPTDKSQTSSRYDNLFANLDKEEAERQKKKLEREEAKKKLEQSELKRREVKLSEKDKKLKKDEERRIRERELAELEEQKRREAEATRNKSLQEEQEVLFKKKMTNIEEAKKRAEENLANQIKQNKIEEKKKTDEIEKMEKENQAEQKRLAKQAELIEEEKEKKLAAIALEDKEERQRIEKRANEEKARIEAEMNKKRQKNDEELKKKENQLKKERDEANEQVRVLERQAELQRTLAKEAKQSARHRERMLKDMKNKDNQIEAHREYLWNQVLDYYWASDEARAGTRSPQQTSHGKLRDWLRNYPNMEFNLYRGDGREYERTNWSGSYRVAMKAFFGVVGADIFVNQYRFQELLKQRVNDLSIGMD